MCRLGLRAFLGDDAGGDEGGADGGHIDLQGVVVGLQGVGEGLGGREVNGGGGDVLDAGEGGHGGGFMSVGGVEPHAIFIQVEDAAGKWTTYEKAKLKSITNAGNL